MSKDKNPIFGKEAALKINDLTRTEQAIIASYGMNDVIAVRVSLVKALGGDGDAAILLSQFIFWAKADCNKNKDGWFYNTQEKMTEQTGLSARVQRRVTTKLKTLKLCESELRGVPARLYYRLDLRAIVNLIVKNCNDFDGSD